jgi:TRAP-type C4-dicarboxylate transport system substrate-binding protein
MKDKKLVLLVSVVLTVLLGSLAVFPGCEEAEPEVYELKIQSGYPHGDVSMELLNDFAAAAEQRSDGQLKISVFADPEIVPLEQLFDATKVGTLDMLQAGGTFWGGIVPVGEIEFGIPFVYNIPEEETFEGKAAEIRRFFFESGFVDILREEYEKQGLYWLDMHTYGPVTLHSTVSVETMEDLQGLKIRDEGLWTVFHDRLGASGTYISGTDAYMALKLGTIDISQWDVSGITGFAWHEVAPYWIHPHQNDQIIGHILVNMDSWNALPGDLKEALADAAEDYWDMTVETYALEVEKAYETPGVEVCWLTDDTVAQWEEIAYGLWDELAAQDPACAQAIELIKEWRGVE